MLTAVEETVHQEDVQAAHVELQRVCKILELGVKNTIGVKHVANVLYLMKVVEMAMP